MARGATCATVKRYKSCRRTAEILFRYCDGTGALTRESNPNGSVANIAGIANERFNVLGMMPHPERACEAILGSEDGLKILQSLVHSALAVAR